MRRRQLLATSAVVVGSAGCLGYTIEDEDYVDSLESEIDSLEGQIATYEADIAQLETELDEKSTTVETLETENDELAMEVSTKTEEIQSLEDEIAAKRDEVADLEGDLDDKGETIAALESDLDELRAELDALSPEHDFTANELALGGEVAVAFRDAVTWAVHAWGAGTAFHVGDGDYLTPYHVARGRGPEGILGIDIDDQEWWYTLGEAHPEIDAKALHADHAPPGTVDVMDFRTPDEHEPILMIGHPHNVGNWIPSIGRYLETDTDSGFVEEAYLADIPIKPGNSGSPVFTLDGTFIGMAVAARQNRDQDVAPDEPFTHFQGYPPDGMIVPASEIVRRMSL